MQPPILPTLLPHRLLLLLPPEALDHPTPNQNHNHPKPQPSHALVRLLVAHKRIQSSWYKLYIRLKPIKKRNTLRISREIGDFIPLLVIVAGFGSSLRRTEEALVHFHQAVWCGVVMVRFCEFEKSLALTGGEASVVWDERHFGL